MNLRRARLCLASTLAGLLLTAGLFALAEVAQAAPRSALATTRNYPGAAPCNTTLQACINGSNNGDVIQIAAGTFTESFTLNKAVNLSGAGAELTTLHAEPNRRVFSVTYTTTQPITISGLTIAGGDATTTNSVLGDGSDGGGVYLRPRPPSLVGPMLVSFIDVVFRDNHASDGGGLHSYVTSVYLTNTVFLNNTATRFGGGLRTLNPLTVTHSQFLSNTAGMGGGLHTGSDTHLRQVELVGNQALGTADYEAYGGGAAIEGGQVVASRFERNDASDGAGGGLYTTASLISDTIFLSNTAGFGGGLHANALVNVVQVTLTANVAEFGGGGAWFVRGATLIGAVVVDNQAGDGGGLFFSSLSQQAIVAESTLSGNIALSSTGTAGIVFGDMRAPSQSVQALVNTILTGTGAPDSRALQVGLGRSLALTGATISGHPIELVALGQQPSLLPDGLITETAGVGLCGLPEFITYTRPITVWYGTLSTPNLPIFSASSASDRLSVVVHRLMQASDVPPAWLRAVMPWVDYQFGSFQNVLLGDGLDPEANLRAAFAGAWRPAPYTGVRFADPVPQGTTEDYLLAQTNDLAKCGEEFQLLDYAWQVRVSFVELNATAVHATFLPSVVR
jgi:hypothetical protein